MIEVQGLRKSFGDNTVLSGVDLKINTGEIFFVLGTSGTGKSVLLKLLVGLLTADAGRIWIDNEEITGFTEEQFFPVRKKCGMVFQHPALFDSLTIYENIAYGARRHRERSAAEEREHIEKCLSLVGLENIEEKRPYQLSYGMQKRASIARTLAIEPQLLLFDEPTTGLDPNNTNTINDLILNLSRELKTTSVVVSHDMHGALATADRIGVLDKGSLVALGTPEEIRKSPVALVREFLLDE